ncbi:MAG: hypothetical protein NC428_10270 [Clostridium sp.]|nr:hypothetical protein [Clostridium sp.]
MIKKESTLMNKIMLVVTAILIMIIFSGAAMYVNAANTGDTAFGFSVQTDSSSPIYTGFRNKEDYSKSYCNITYMASSLHNLYVAPYGSSSSSDVRTNTATTGGYYTINKLGKYHISNYTKERGYARESLGFRAKSGYGRLEGKWSPDSAYTGSDITVLP